MSFSEEPSAQIEVKLANVFLLGNAAPNNARTGIVGWFPLVPKDVGGSRLTGELKLRFHLKRAHLLEALDCCDGVLFASERRHNVTTCTGGVRRAFVLELWEGAENRHNRHR